MSKSSPNNASEAIFVDEREKKQVDFVAAAAATRRHQSADMSATTSLEPARRAVQTAGYKKVRQRLVRELYKEICETMRKNERVMTRKKNQTWKRVCDIYGQ